MVSPGRSETIVVTIGTIAAMAVLNAATIGLTVGRTVPIAAVVHRRVKCREPHRTSSVAIIAATQRRKQNARRDRRHHEVNASDARPRSALSDRRRRLKDLRNQHREPKDLRDRHNRKANAWAGRLNGHGHSDKLSQCRNRSRDHSRLRQKRA